MGTKRKQERSHLTYYLDVVDIWSGDVLGKVADITTEGLMVLTKSSIDVGTEKELKIVSSDKSFSPIEFKSDCRWCRKDVNPDYYDVGFHMDEINEEDAKTVKDLISNSYFDH